MILSVVLSILASAILSDARPATRDFRVPKSKRSLEERSSSAAAYCSSSNGDYTLTEITAPVQGSGDAGSEGTWTIAFDDTSSGQRQTVVGFGACITDATVSVLDSLSSSSLDSLLTTLLTTDGDNGAGFSLFRHTIGASDLSADPAYTYDDAGGDVDTSLNDFNLGDRGTSMAKLIAQMQSMSSDVQVLGSPWSAPGWMKINGVLDGNTTGNNLLDGYYDPSLPNYASSFAQYFVKYIEAYADQDATIDFITIQNEPLNSNAGYPTMYVYADESAELINDYVGPALADAGLNVPIWALDHNTNYESYASTVISDAGNYAKAVAWHCYANPLDWSVLSDFHNNNKDVDQYMTECWTSSEYTPWWWASNFTGGPLNNWAKGAMAWTLATNDDEGPHLSGDGACDTCRGLITVNDGDYTFQIDYYIMAQYSRYIPRGATILENTAGNYIYSDGSGVLSTATLNPDGTRTIVIQNVITSDLYVTLNLQSGETWSGSVPGSSVVTWTLPSASSDGPAVFITSNSTSPSHSTSTSNSTSAQWSASASPSVAATNLTFPSGSAFNPNSTLPSTSASLVNLTSPSSSTFNANSTLLSTSASLDNPTFPSSSTLNPNSTLLSTSASFVDPTSALKTTAFTTSTSPSNSTSLLNPITASESSLMPTSTSATLETSSLTSLSTLASAFSPKSTSSFIANTGFFRNTTLS